MYYEGWWFRAPWYDWPVTKMSPYRTLSFDLLPTVHVWAENGMRNVYVAWLFFAIGYSWKKED